MAILLIKEYWESLLNNSWRSAILGCCCLLQFFSCSNKYTTEYFVFGDVNSSCWNKQVFTKQYLKDQSFVESCYQQQESGFALLYRDTLHLKSDGLHSSRISEVRFDTNLYHLQNELNALLANGRPRMRDLVIDSLTDAKIQKHTEKVLDSLGFSTNLNLQYTSVERTINQDNQPLFLFTAPLLCHKILFDPKSGIVGMEDMDCGKNSSCLFNGMQLKTKVDKSFLKN